MLKHNQTCNACQHRICENYVYTTTMQYHCHLMSNEKKKRSRLYTRCTVPHAKTGYDRDDNFFLFFLTNTKTKTRKNSIDDTDAS